MASARKKALSSQGPGELAAALRLAEEKEAFNFALFQHNPLPMTVVDCEGCVLKSNLARRRTGEKLPALGEQLFGQNETDHGLDLQAALNTCIKSGEVADYPELKMGERCVNLTISPFPKGAIVIYQDITARKAAQEQLIQADKMVALGTLVSGVAHELSNPNHVMLLSASQLQRVSGPLLEVLDEYQKLNGDFNVGARPYEEFKEDLPGLVDVIDRAADRIKRLVDELKDFARKEDSGETEPVDVNVAVKGAVTLLGAILRKSTDHFSECYAEKLPCVMANSQRIEQVLVNLLANACQALPSRDRGITLSTELAKKKRMVLIKVKDEGSGISKKNMARIKDPFFTTKHDTGGTGLGLSISDKIISGYGGSLTFESVAGEGTTVTVAFPVAGAKGGSSTQGQKSGRGRSA